MASIPSPSWRSLDIGSLELRAYGLMIALGVVAAAWLFSRRFTQRGHSPDLATSATVWAVIAGLIGARVYHVITDWKSFRGNWGEAWQIWEGGLGIPGAVMAAALAMWVFARAKKIPLSDVADSVAPALPLGQAIGRWGNWFNQELYGRPTDLPWALEIDPRYRPDKYRADETFHPTFLYECIWNLALMGVLLWVSKRFTLKPGRLFGLYVLGYALGRLWIETIRVDFASELAGVRVNIWVMLALIAGSVVFLLWRRGSQDEALDSESLGDGAPEHGAPEHGAPEHEAHEDHEEQDTAQNITSEA
ncbi:prolipoprotein diacylglyceryl transferase [Candidatus Poriferisocius sp.]|uniref:prolipoprotein diacylglyceryl transferase n=1 Tax=Candidatus Poriferisocius sp. TaxID=3101276 RepID=UPI003B58BF56